MKKYNEAESVTAALLMVILVCFIAMFWMAITIDDLRGTHSDVISESNRSLQEYKCVNSNLVKMINIFTEGKPVLITAYNAHENQTDDTPTVTANGETVVAGGMALSRDFLKVFDQKNDVAYGDTILLITDMRVNDTMNARFTGRADIFMWSYSDAMSFGAREGFIYYDN